MYAHGVGKYPCHNVVLIVDEVVGEIEKEYYAQTRILTFVLILTLTQTLVLTLTLTPT